MVRQLTINSIQYTNLSEYFSNHQRRVPNKPAADAFAEGLEAISEHGRSIRTTAAAHGHLQRSVQTCQASRIWRA